MPRKSKNPKGKPEQIILYGEEVYDIEKWVPNIRNLATWLYPSLTPDNREDLIQQTLFKLIKYNFPHRIKKTHTFSNCGSYVWSVMRNEFLSNFYCKKYFFLQQAMEVDEEVYRDIGYLPEYEEEIMEQMIDDPYMQLQYELIQEDPKKYFKNASQQTKDRVKEHFKISDEQNPFEDL